MSGYRIAAIRAWRLGKMIVMLMDDDCTVRKAGSV